MDDQNKNLILATVLSFLVILGWFVAGPMLFPQWFPAETQAPLTAVSDDAAATPDPGTTAPAGAVASTEPLPESPRLTIDTPKLSGAISMLGGRFDDLSLKTYHETIEPGSPTVKLLSPVGEGTPYYAVFGWAPGAGLTADDVPGAKTAWQIASGGTLVPGKPVTLRWENAKGLKFLRTIAVDDDYMFTVTDSVENTGATAASLYSYGIVARHGLPKLQNIYVVHEGLVRRTDGSLEELNYSKFASLTPNEKEGYPAEVSEAATDGWIGFTDHYWMTTLIPEQGKPYTAVAKYVPGSDIYQAEVRQPLMTVGPGAKIETSTRMFAGAKEWEAIRDYQDKAGIPGFIDSIDWGWFYFLTKPIFSVLHWLHGLIGNMGLAIIGLTFILKLLVLPLAYKSYVSMARMKELQPEMEVLKERAGDDKQKLQKDMMALYKERKVNPAAGCLPIFIQIPIFFSLYKVIFVTIELRQAPFFGWIKDLSAPDSSSIFNLFGALPWDAPAPHTLLATIFIGVLPILLGITMWLQQKLNPAPADPVQQQLFAWMPFVFMFMLGGFASGLVVYWITNNTITFAQQYLIMRSHGHKPDLFGNIKSGFSKKKPVEVAKK
ncbi:membrane protein insertase YidC [Cypionkella aquatica]|uniref:Membrane protein insertase YidC n=1 Tax=Cypionkella aquatica TaxID=1756042 RepID=A0AA37U7U7_9RHOB|nr:membrane protein insertase YidC [Cypionkella aquatica]GLS88480.1 membrane protein insertase YidC [Cypionkella aquatica]